MLLFRYFVFSALIISTFILSSSAFAQKNKARVHQVTINKFDEYLQYTKGQRRLLYIYRSTSKPSRKRMNGIMDLERAKEGSVIAISVDNDHIKFAKYIKTYMRHTPFNILLLRAKEGVFRKMLIEKYGASKWDLGGAAAGAKKKKSSYPVMIFIDEENNIVKQGTYDVENVAEFLFGIAPAKNKQKKEKNSFFGSLFSFF